MKITRSGYTELTRTLPLRIRARFAVVCGTACLLALSACSDQESDTAQNGTPNGNEQTPLDCVVMDYPCTWAEVPLHILEQTQQVVDEVEESLRADQSVEQVAKWLQDRPEIAEVQQQQGMLRFRVHNGRAIWIGDPESTPPNLQSFEERPTRAFHDISFNGFIPSAQAQSNSSKKGRRDAVGDQSAGDRPEKAVLFLDPFRWEFKLDVFDGIVPVEDDASHVLPKLFQEVRDYKCDSKVENCDCPNGECYVYRGIDWANFCDPSSPSCRIQGSVTPADFKSWRQFQVIHVATHGYRVCTGSNCQTALATGALLSDRLHKLAVNYPGPQPASSSTAWLYEPGVEFVKGLNVHRPLNALLGRQAGYCARLTPGTPGYDYANCSDNTATHWKVLVGVDFFRENYRPDDLKDKLIYLAACTTLGPGRSAVANYLAGPNKSNTIIGWDSPAKNSSQSRAARIFYTAWLKGKTPTAALAEVEQNPAYQSIDILNDQSTYRGASDQSAAPVLPENAGRDEKRGIETVFLLNALTGSELQDGGSLPVLTEPGDGNPEVLDMMIEVVGVEPDDRPEDHVLRLRIDGKDIPSTARLTREVREGAHRFRGEIDLGFDVAPDVRVDVEVSADLPGGGETRWIYKDIALTAEKCSWSATLSGQTPATGMFSGTAGSVTLDSSAREPLDIDAWPGEGQPDYPRPQPPWLVISLRNQDLSVLRDPTQVSEFRFAIPVTQPDQTGSFDRVWGKFIAGPMSYEGNADYLRRDVIGLPEGTGIGHLLTTSVNITSNDAERVEGTFQARFLNPEIYQNLGPYQRAPLGVGIHPIPEAEIQSRGEFSLLKDGGCGSRFNPRRLRGGP